MGGQMEGVSPANSTVCPSPRHGWAERAGRDCPGPSAPVPAWLGSAPSGELEAVLQPLAHSPRAPAAPSALGIPGLCSAFVPAAETRCCLRGWHEPRVRENWRAGPVGGR